MASLDGDGHADHLSGGGHGGGYGEGEGADNSSYLWKTMCWTRNAIELIIDEHLLWLVYRRDHKGRFLDPPVHYNPPTRTQSPTPVLNGSKRCQSIKQAQWCVRQ